MTVTATASGLDIAVQDAGRLGRDAAPGGRRFRPPRRALRDCRSTARSSSSRGSPSSCSTASPSRRRPAASCRRRRSPSRAMADLVRAHLASAQGSPTSSPAAAALRCGWRKPPKCMRSKAMPAAWRARPGVPGQSGPEAGDGGAARPFPPPADGQGACRLRRAGLRSAARRRRGPVETDRPLDGSARRGGFLQPGRRSPATCRSWSMAATA